MLPVWKMLSIIVGNFVNLFMLSIFLEEEVLHDGYRTKFLYDDILVDDMSGDLELKS